MRVCANCGEENPGRARFCLNCGEALAEPEPAREQRKVVTVVFCDVVGSTSLGESTDPEAIRATLARYFERMRDILESHGGTVEKFIGDAVMAVFGVPVVHEDDALRALRAAVEMREALPEIGLEGRIGVATGEVVTGTAERLATGDAVNVAARLEQAAGPGEILISAETQQLARDAVEAESIEPLALKGKAENVAAYRLHGVRAGAAFARHFDSPMVGRETELRRLRDAYDQSLRDSSCQLFTVLGPAGVGKSRLITEFLASVGETAVARGQCLPYGEGITYWPVVSVLKQLPETDLDDSAARALESVFRDEPGVSTQEIAWAFRKKLEAVAEERPLVCVFDDLQWGEETFLDLVEHVADLSRDAPILLLCMSRPDLLERRPGWAGGKVNATNVLLEPLPPEESRDLIAHLSAIDEGLRDRIVEAAEGNPLFVEEMVALVDQSTGEIEVPPTIRALLAARLDQLDYAERGVLERGAIEGRVFHRGAVQAMAPEEDRVTDRLTSLVRKELVRPDRSQVPGEDAYRFRHLLIRDAAYEALPKAIRADLHERFALWLEEHGEGLVEIDEITGYHLEQASRYRVELGGSEEGLGRRAAERLSAAAKRALARGDLPAAVSLLDRTIALDASRTDLLMPLGRALVQRAEWKRAEAAMRRAAATDDRALATDAAVGLSFLRLHTDPDSTQAEVHRLLDEAIPVFVEFGDEAALGHARALRGMLRFWHGDVAAAEVELAGALPNLKAAGAVGPVAETLRYMLLATVLGPTPVWDAVARLEWIAGQGGGLGVQLAVQSGLAELASMQGRCDDARQLLHEATARIDELGFMLLAGLTARTAAEIHLRCGDPAAAQQVLRPACEELQRIGDVGHLASHVAYLVDALLLLGRGEEAAPFIEMASEWTLEDDRDAQAGVRRVRAKLLAERGQLDEAERDARDAVAIVAQTQYVILHADALRDLAIVLAAAGKREEAAAAATESVALSERKGDIAKAERTRELLGTL